MGFVLFRSGEWVYHPRYGYGTILGVAQQDVGHLVHGNAAGQAEDYYEIRLRSSGTLFVPVARVDVVGLRPVTNGLDAIAACLASPPDRLPEDSRERLAQLRSKEQAREPVALSRAVRDLAACSRQRSLTAAEQKWLDQACRSLSTEAALVDNITETMALAAIRQAVAALSAHSP